MKCHFYLVSVIHDTACTTFPQTVNDIVEVLDDIQVWPEEVVEDMGSE